MWQNWTQSQLEALRPFVEGRHVHDLGSGPEPARLSRVLRRKLGAKAVTAVDKVLPRNRVPIHDEAEQLVMEVCGLSFEEFAVQRPEPLDCAIVAWPVNWKVPALMSILKRTNTIVYLGSNQDLTSCGGPDFWDLMSRRAVLAEIYERYANLLIFGQPIDKPRPLTSEENDAHIMWESVGVKFGERY